MALRSHVLPFLPRLTSLSHPLSIVCATSSRFEFGRTKISITNALDLLLLNLARGVPTITRYFLRATTSPAQLHATESNLSTAKKQIIVKIAKLSRGDPIAGFHPVLAI